MILPALLPALLTGFALAFARGVGEYGSVIFIAGNMPMRSEIAPLLIMIKLEQYDYAGATAIAAFMLVISFVMLLSSTRCRPGDATRGTAHELASAAIEDEPRCHCDRRASNAAPAIREPRWVRLALIGDRARCSSALFLVAAAGRRVRRGAAQGLSACTSRRSPTPTRWPRSG